MDHQEAERNTSAVVLLGIRAEVWSYIYAQYAYESSQRLVTRNMVASVFMLKLKLRHAHMYVQTLYWRGSSYILSRYL